MNKELIKKRFSKNLSVYNINAKIQNKMAEKLINFLPDNNYNSILEIGCGTGLLTQQVIKKVNYKMYTAIDFVDECKTFIHDINPNINFLSIDAEDYINSYEEKYDLIISNASLQWINNLPKLIEKLVSKLNPNGILLFSVFGKENFREIYYILGKTLSYYSKTELEENLKKYSANIEEEIRIMAFKTPKDVLKHIKNTGVNAITTQTWTKKDLIDFETRYNTFCANHPTLTYNPMYIYIQNR